LADKAIAELEKVLQVYPNQIDIYQRILEISRKGLPQRGAAAAAQLARIFTDRGDTETASKYQAIASGTGALQEPPPTPLSPATTIEKSEATALAVPERPNLGSSEQTSIAARLPEGLTGAATAAPPEAVALTLPLDEAPGENPVAPLPPFSVPSEAIELDLSGDLESFVALETQAASPSVPESPASRLMVVPSIAEAPAPPEETVAPRQVQESSPTVEAPIEGHGAEIAAEEAIPTDLKDSRTEIEFYLENGFVDEARQAVAALEQQYPGNSFVAELRRRIPELPDGAPPPAVQPVPAVPENKPAVVEPPVASQLSSLLEEMEHFGGPVQDDPETHYNLGVAFREMGLLDEAIGEFQKVVKGSRKGNFPPNFLQACTLLAACFMEKKMPAIAVRWYARALETPGLEEEAVMALHYDLGVAYEQAGDSHRALEKFTEVYSQNIDFRDVAEKVRLLHQKA
jgi:tetratricopeptide (TPR) repeat protein